MNKTKDFEERYQKAKMAKIFSIYENLFKGCKREMSEISDLSMSENTRIRAYISIMENYFGEISLTHTDKANLKENVRKEIEEEARWDRIRFHCYLKKSVGMKNN